MNVKPKNRIIIGYCRVSSHKQKDDLERQIEIIDKMQEEADGKSHKSNVDPK